MIDRLGELLREHDFLYGVICRDATLTDIELMAREGYHVVWLDLEHSSQSTSEAVRLGRAIAHLGMVPLVRIPELSRSHVQVLLDGGIQALCLPDVRDASTAARFVQLAKYPPMGQRGVSSTTAGTGFTLGTDPERTLRETNDATHLMVMFESDEGYGALDEIIAIDGIDIVTVGASDWSVGLGLFTEEDKTQLTAKIERVLSTASRAGKIVAAEAGDTDRAGDLAELGVRIFFLGVDITLKRRALAQSVAGIEAALGTRTARGLS